MALRTRLTVAFLAVVLGPVLLAALFAGGTVAAVTHSRLDEQLRYGSATVSTATVEHCRRLIAVAKAAGALTGDQAADQAARVIDHNLVQVQRPDGQVIGATPGLPQQPWATCVDTANHAPATPAPAAGSRYQALAARVGVYDAGNHLLRWAVAVEPLDQDFLAGSTPVSGVSVGLLPVEPDGAEPDGAEPDGAEPDGAEPDGVLSQRVPPGPQQPVPLVVSVRAGDSTRLYLVLVAVVLGAGLVAVAVAWWLARTTTEPLVQLAGAVERVAAGDLRARVPVLSRDEVGRLGVSFNRMARETQAYVEALTASRDQLRNNLALLGDTLSSTHDLDRIFEVILRTAAVASSGQAGVIILAAPPVPGRPQLLIGRYGIGLAGRVRPGLPITPEELRVRVGEGLLGAVAASGEPMRGRFEPCRILADREPRSRTFIAVPFVGGGGATRAEPTARATDQVLGVMAIYDRFGDEEFDETDPATLRTFAGQAAVAVRNVLLHDEAKRLSVTDPLTGMSNYRHLRDQLRVEVERAARLGRRLGVLVLDLDHFKTINDTHGHRAGDVVLAEFANRVRGQLREFDLTFRSGGEEFVILLPDTDAVGGVATAQRLGAVIRDTPFSLPTRWAPSGDECQNVRIPISVSIGIAIYPDHADAGPQVLDLADAALYAAKSAGRDRYVLAGPAGLSGASDGSTRPSPAHDG